MIIDTLYPQVLIFKITLTFCFFLQKYILELIFVNVFIDKVQRLAIKLFVESSIIKKIQTIFIYNVRFGLVSLFNGISTLYRLFNAESILLVVVLFNPYLGG